MPTKKLNWKDLLFSYKGRINRAVYWMVTLLSALAVLILFGILTAIGQGQESMTSIIVAIIVLPIISWIEFVCQIKRWHDRGKSGIWILFSFVPIVGQIWVLVETYMMKGDEGENKYGPDPLA